MHDNGFDASSTYAKNRRTGTAKKVRSCSGWQQWCTVGRPETMQKKGFCSNRQICFHPKRRMPKHSCFFATVIAFVRSNRPKRPKATPASTVPRQTNGICPCAEGCQSIPTCFFFVGECFSLTETQRLKNIDTGGLILSVFAFRQVLKHVTVLSIISNDLWQTNMKKWHFVLLWNGYLWFGPVCEWFKPAFKLWVRRSLSLGSQFFWFVLALTTSGLVRPTVSVELNCTNSYINKFLVSCTNSVLWLPQCAWIANAAVAVNWSKKLHNSVFCKGVWLWINNQIVSWLPLVMMFQGTKTLNSSIFFSLKRKVTWNLPLEMFHTAVHVNWFRLLFYCHHPLRKSV